MKNIKTIGRFLTDSNGFYMHSWSGSGIEFDTYSTSLKVDIFTEYSTYEIWVVIELNESILVRTMLMPGMNTIPVYKNLNPEDRKSIRIYKESQLDLDANTHFMSVRKITDFNNNEIEILPSKERDFSIEFIGDSITTGEGLYGSVEDMEYSYCYDGFSKTFAKLTADYFDADYSVISQCGFGIACGWNNDPKMKIPDVYSFTDGKEIEYDFQMQHDIVVINLGTNDSGAFNMDAFEVDGIKHKITEEDFIERGINFLNYVLIKNPKAHIIWMIGMCDVVTTKAIKQIVSSAAEINRVSFLKVNSANDIDFGSRQHPGPKTHKDAARHLINRINEMKNK